MRLDPNAHFNHANASSSLLGTHLGKLLINTITPALASHSTAAMISKLLTTNKGPTIPVANHVLSEPCISIPAVILD